MRLAGLAVYPVKGLHGNALEQAAVEPLGIAGDRRWLVVDEANRFITQRTVAALATLHVTMLPDGITLARGTDTIQVPTPKRGDSPVRVQIWRDSVIAENSDPAASAWLSEQLGIACRLVYMADPDARPIAQPYGAPTDHVGFSDGFPILVTNTASLAELNSRLANPVPMTRFRPNVVVETAEPWAEDQWRRLRIGPVVLRLAKPCTRCVVTGIDQDTGAQPDPGEPLRTLVKYRFDKALGGVVFGQNAIPETPGTIRLGDRVELLG